jgi:hypothetical protein
MTDVGDVNLAWWDERARLHGQDGLYYDTEGFLNGALAISERERSELISALGQLEDKDVLHMQCHIGLTTLSLGRLGARTVGVDFSPVQDGTPVARDDGDYADPTAETEHRAAVHFRWGVGDVVTRAIDAGFMIEVLTEWTNDESGIELPSAYSLRARRSG